MDSFSDFSAERDTVAPVESSTGDALLLLQTSGERATTLAGALARDTREIVTLASGAGLESLVAARSPDVVLVDVALPELGALCRRIRTCAPAAAIVVADWLGHSEARAVHALEADADEYAAVSPHLLELSLRVDAQIRRRRLRESRAVERPTLPGNDATFRDEPETVADAPNRRALDRELAKMLCEDAPVSVLFVGVDHFADINQIHGRLAGDRTLTALSGLLREHARARDFVARYGAEEFVVALRSTDLDAAWAFAERIRGAVERLVAPGVLRHFTISVGIATRRPSSDESAEDFLCRADLALCDAKVTGRNRVVVAGERGPGPVSCGPETVRGGLCAPAA